MYYYTNTEIALRFGISNATVTHWITGAHEGKNELKVEQVKNKFKVINNAHNNAIMQMLFENGKKHRNSVVIKHTSPSSSFYQNYTSFEIAEIYNDLLTSSECKFKFSYKDGGAKAWDEYYQSGVSQHIKINENFLYSSLVDLTQGLKLGQKVNVIDLGPGNGYPVKPLLEYISKNFSLSKYIAIDISENINSIVQSNIASWFPNLKIITSKVDLDRDTVAEVMYSNTQSDEVNLVAYLGHTICNHENYGQLLKNLRIGIQKDDCLFFTYTNAHSNNRGVFNYVNNQNADYRHALVLNLLGVDVNECELIMEYDEAKNARFKYLILDKDYSIKLKLYNQEKILELKSNQRISIWQHYLIDDNHLLENLKSAYLGLGSLKLDETQCHSFVICKTMV